MSLKLGTTNINIPYEKAHLGSQLIYVRGGDFVDTEFTACPFPFDWVEVTTGIEYKGTNDYGDWKITTTSYRNSTYTLKNAFDSNNNTAWGGAIPSDDNSSLECIIECPIGVEIQLAQIYLKYIYLGNATNNARLQGYNEVNGYWEDLYTLQASTSTKSETIDISSKNYYSKFRVLIYRYRSNTHPTLYEFQITGGTIRQII